MAGTNIEVQEIEQLLLTKSGRGLIYTFDSTNCQVEAAGSSPWTGISSNLAGASRKFLSAPSSLAWVKIHYVSGSTYGPTGATLYIPAYTSLTTTAP